jgi:hypothetical protein
MILLNDFITHINKRKSPRYLGEINKEIRYACYCEKCNSFRGYIKLSHYKKKSKLCKKCYCNTDNFIEKQRKNTKNYFIKNPYKVDPIKALKRRISVNLRNRLNRAIKGNYRTGSAVRDLGCSINGVKSHLESLFQPGMTWENYGCKGWHIDHITPLNAFDLCDLQQVKKACHYMNLQPLWAKDNISKSDRAN